MKDDLPAFQPESEPVEASESEIDVEPIPESKREIEPEKSSQRALIGPLIALVSVLILVAVVWKKTVNPTVEWMERDTIVFNRLHFNRYLVYGNAFEKSAGLLRLGKSELFSRQIILHVQGRANIAFKTSQLHRDGKRAIYAPDKQDDGFAFDLQVDIDTDDIRIVDELKPRPVNSREAAVAGGVLALAGGFAGAQAGDAIASVIPGGFFNLQGHVARLVGLAGGAGVGFGVGYGLAKDVQLAEQVSQTELETVKGQAAVFITGALRRQSFVQQQSEKRFRQFLIEKFRQSGVKITSVRVDQEVGS
ncbi:MAG: hypothetical protein HQL54_00945 [Magnetococcales bacterium]|nr:hypothetical protein [Magnetococcales bacterium]